MSDNAFEETHERELFVNSDDSKLLLVKGNLVKGKSKDYVKKLANAIFKVVMKHDVATLRCVGAASVNNAIKGTIVASVEAKKKGMDLALIPSFQNIEFPGVGEKTSVVLEVIQINSEQD